MKREKLKQYKYGKGRNVRISDDVYFDLRRLSGLYTCDMSKIIRQALNNKFLKQIKKLNKI